MNQLEFTFNWSYVDVRNIALFSSGRLPIRALDVASGLPTDGTGAHEWSGFEPLAAHARGVNPPSGTILNWNNKPALGFSASDDNWGFGPVQRVQLLQAQVAKRKVHTLASLAGAMNAAATQDLRTVQVLPTLERVLGNAPNAFDAQLLQRLESWRAAGASRLDLDGDGKIDDPGAAIMDAAWPLIADAALRPRVGALTDRLKTLISVDDPASSGGSSYYGAWYSYVERELTTPGLEPAPLWAALDAAGRKLAAQQGPDPGQWHADATKERITFGFLPLTARWTNRPTFQQVITFSSHRPR
jgi:acyl-homoserine lactone acylase PvdQ